MMENHLKRVLNLVRNTGDTMVVVDKDGDDSFVVMNLDQYEMLLDTQMGYEDALQLEPSQDQSTPKNEAGSNIWDVMQEAGEEGETWDIDQLSQEEYKDLEKQYEAFAKGHVEQAVAETQKVEKLEESPKINKIKEDDDYGEEQFYLEPVE